MNWLNVNWYTVTAASLQEKMREYMAERREYPHKWDDLTDIIIRTERLYSALRVRCHRRHGVWV